MAVGCSFAFKNMVLQNREHVYYTAGKIWPQPYIRYKRIICELGMYMFMALPYGVAFNFYTTGNFLRGAFFTTLFVAMCFRYIDSNSPQQV
mmetsp:Transcript_32984/g.32140  ORF Transcript_32984/g.32140 Transcript_32984/m.32140 type:complete len:91 (+) Transcript_32984:205-477(+)